MYIAGPLLMSVSHPLRPFTQSKQYTSHMKYFQIYKFVGNPEHISQIYRLVQILIHNSTITILGKPTVEQRQ